MMIHAALHWPEEEDQSLWPLAVSYAAHLYNHTPNFTSGIAPIEIFTKTKSDHKVIKQAHPWGCPAYVLEPSLTQAGSKIPKWQPKSRRAQFVGFSPLHSENIGLVRNLASGYITPQYHIIFDDWFETVHAPEGPPPRQWDEMTLYQRMYTVFDPDDRPPPLGPEWNPPQPPPDPPDQPPPPPPRQGRRLLQDVANRDTREDRHFMLPPAQVQPPASPVPVPAVQPPTPAPAQVEAREQSSPTPGVRRSARQRNPVDRLQPMLQGKRHGYNRPAAMFAAAMLGSSSFSPQSHHMLTQQAVGFDVANGFQEDIHPWTTQTPWALKAKASKDPDLPSVREALSGPYADDFWKAMEKEINTLESMETWEVVPRASMPKGAKAIPGTWAFRVKRFPDGRLNKFKARWCVMGNRMEKGVHYFEDAYSPLVGWPTVRSAMILSATAGWKSRQVDFTNAFCQAPQKDLIFVELPQYYKPASCEGKDVVLRLKKSLYGQVTSPKLFWEHLQKGMLKLGFEQSKSDPCLFFHPKHKLMVLNYCDDQIWLSPDNALIEEYAGKLKALGYELTLEKEGDMFAFLGIDFKRHGSKIELSQRGLIEKVINYVGLKDCTPRSTPAATAPLGSDKNGTAFQESWSYPAAVGMLLYLSSNTRPDIQFAVHQVARFSHSPKQSHGQAIKRIIRYLSSTKERGILFEPDLKAGLDCYVDADFAGLYGYEDDQDPVSVKSRTGFVLTLFGCPIIWSSKLQTEITLSSTAAEYVAFSMAMRELLPMRALLQELASKLNIEFAKQSLVRSTVFEDNQGCLSMVNTPKMSSRNKYLSLKYHFFRSHIGKEKGIEAKWIDTKKQKADIFTKGLAEAQFQEIRKLLMGW
jgi:Reverse transcriptase (RNA-dependent DNA polymerase)